MVAGLPISILVALGAYSWYEPLQFIEFENMTRIASSDAIIARMYKTNVNFFGRYTQKGYMCYYYNINNYGSSACSTTILIFACKMRMRADWVCQLIQTNQSKPEIADLFGCTALIYVSRLDLYFVSSGDDYSDYERDSCTYKVALALLATGKSNPGAQTKDGNTALIYACDNNYWDLVLALLATGESNVNAINEYGKTAISIVRNKIRDIRPVFHPEQTLVEIRKKNIMIQILSMLYNESARVRRNTAIIAIYL